MKRKLTNYLAAWKTRKDHKPLLIRGARQVGKTYCVEEFAKSYFKNIITVNFEDQVELKSTFKEFNVEQILDELSVYFSTEIIPGETLLFFDEIQSCPEAIIKLRYFYEHYPDLHIIAAGSLLDFTLREMNYSMPVGRIEFCYMYPMNFEEFLIALSQEKIAGYIRDFSFQKSYSLAIHKKILSFFRLYLLIGGMPEVVRTYVEQEQLLSVERIRNDILTALQYDFAKYGTKKQQEHLVTILRYSANNIGNKVKYSNINRDTRSNVLKEAFYRLELSRILHLVYHTNANQVPLTTYIKNDVYKPLFLDIGLANHLNGIRLIELENILTNNEGATAEQFIGQELLTIERPFIDTKLYYWTREQRNSNAEIDYIYQHGNTIYPIEVKSGKTGTLKSMQLYLFEKGLNKGIRFNLDMPSIGSFYTRVNSKKKTGELNYTLISLPLYMCFNLEKIIEESF